MLQKNKMEIQLAQLIQFLNEHKTSVQNSPYTHVLIGPPYGKFNIELCNQEKFHSLYSQCVTNNDLYIAEKPVDLAPFIIDIDFLQNISVRQYTLKDIITLKLICDTVIKQYYNVFDNNLTAFILEKENPTITTNIYKDGFHIIYPHLATSKIIRKYLINDIINLVKSKMIFNKLKLLMILTIS